MQTNTAIEFLPSVSEDQKIDVSLENDKAIIKLSTFTEGLGWTCQKTMCLDGTLLDDLHRAISAARYRLNSAKTHQQIEGSSKVISFPSIA